jgi:hypothetical protein
MCIEGEMWRWRRELRSLALPPSHLIYLPNFTPSHPIYLPSLLDILLLGGETQRWWRELSFDTDRSLLPL